MNGCCLFRKDHFSISAIYTSQDKDSSKNVWPSITLSKQQLKNQARQNAPSFTGIGQGEGVSIGIIKKDGRYKGVVLSSEDSRWKRFDLKLCIDDDSSALKKPIYGLKSSILY